MDYKKAGVDIEAGYKSVELMKEHVKKTMREEVLGGLGGFSGAFSLAKIKDMEEPVLLSGTDGCGTKVKLAMIMDKHDTIGIDAVAMCVNDIACAGGEPLFFLDYIACGKNYPEKIADIVKGAAEVGVDTYRSEVLPEDKAHFVAEEQAQGHTVIMLGDGINDSPALSAADVGIAISDGAAIAREIADITISADGLMELVTLRTIATALMKRIQSNYRFVIGFNGGLIALGTAGVLAPATSAMLHNLSTLGVSLRSMTNLLASPPEQEQPRAIPDSP